MIKHLFVALLTLAVSVAAAAENYLISPSATTEGEEIKFKNITFNVGTTAFPSFSTFLASNPDSNSKVYVDEGTYSENVTITTPGLTFFGNNAYGETRSGTRLLPESVITGKITVNADNTIINGFHFTGNGCVVNTEATTASPLVGFRFNHNKVTESTLPHNLRTCYWHL
ncbi:MAG: hypothetical protein IJS19_00540 [Muribaculaceae bacterium]|nr:hypothetical protein [Muribaculaceae bacterium]